MFYCQIYIITWNKVFKKAI